MTTYLGHGRNSKFNWWDHWPVSQFASAGRGATSADRPSHSSLAHIGLPDTATAEWEPYEQEERKVVKIMLNGLTDKAVEDLLPLAMSWLNARELSVDGELECKGYDPTQMAYVLEGSGDATLELEAQAGGTLLKRYRTPCEMSRWHMHRPTSTDLAPVPCAGRNDYFRRVWYVVM